MNERLKELMIQADYPAPELALRAHRLAELIVQECGQVLVDNTPVVDPVEDWDKGYDRAMNDCIHHIYEHFGVSDES